MRSPRIAYSTDLESAFDLVERVMVVAHDLAGLRIAAKVFSQFEHLCYGGHSVFLRGKSGRVSTSTLTRWYCRRLLTHPAAAGRASDHDDVVLRMPFGRHVAVMPARDGVETHRPLCSMAVLHHGPLSAETLDRPAVSGG